MRLWLFLAFGLALAGCVSQVAEGGTPANAAQPQKVNVNASVNASGNVIADMTGNMSANPLPIPAPGANNTAAGNISANLTAGANATTGAPEAEKNSSAANATLNRAGILFGDGEYALVFDDLSVPDGNACALLSVDYASNYSAITKLEICPGESEVWTDPGGRVFRILVLKTAAGYSGSAGWAQVEIFG